MIGTSFKKITMTDNCTTRFISSPATGSFYKKASFIGNCLNTTNKIQEMTRTLTVVTGEVTDITDTTAICSGSVIATGVAVIAKGICWGTTPAPSICCDKTMNGSGAGNIVGVITGLDEQTLYYFRAYAIKSNGEPVYGVEKTFTTIATEILFGYFVSNDGNDSNDGKSINTPWKTLNKVSSSTFVNGDCIYFRRGHTFEGSLTLTKSALTSAKVTYGAYGSGTAKPIITSMKLIYFLEFNL